MHLKLKHLQKINDKCKCSVFGYIRRIQRESPTNIHIIPMIINYLCLSYFFVGECFEKCGDNMEISNGDMTLTKVKDRLKCKDIAFGNKWIKSNIGQIAQWKFKINEIFENLKECDVIWIYFVTQDQEIHSDWASTRNQPYYGFANNSGGDSSSDNDNGDLIFQQDDIINVKLDTITASIKAMHNRNDTEVVIYDNIETGDNIQYKLSVELYGKSTSITLLDFSVHFQ